MEPTDATDYKVGDRISFEMTVKGTVGDIVGKYLTIDLADIVNSKIVAIPVPGKIQKIKPGVSRTVFHKDDKAGLMELLNRLD